MLPTLLPARLLQSGYAVLGVDLRGMGGSTSPEGAATAAGTFEGYVADIDAGLERARRRFPRVPLFILGSLMRRRGDARTRVAEISRVCIAAALHAALAGRRRAVPPCRRLVPPPCAAVIHCPALSPCRSITVPSAVPVHRSQAMAAARSPRRHTPQ